MSDRGPIPETWLVARVYPYAFTINPGEPGYDFFIADRLKNDQFWLYDNKLGNKGYAVERDGKIIDHCPDALKN